MGLRERNAAQTRELILDTALPLFLEQGYDATTMEEIAERAEIGTSTLYRYFPTKDLLVLEPLALNGQMAAELSSRPAEEPLPHALGHALRALLLSPRGNLLRIRLVGDVIESTPSLATRLLEEFVKERRLLEESVAKRLGRSYDDLFCVMTARLATTVLELATERARDHGTGASTGSRPPTDVSDHELRSVVHGSLDRLHEVLEQLHLEPPVFPRLSPPPTPAG